MENKIEYVGTVKAASLLKICPQRVRQLLAERRIEGAFKEGRFWKIPLYKGIPKIIPGSRGPQGTWRKRPQKVPTRIHVNSDRIRANINKDTLDPVIMVRQGCNRVTYCDEVKINGPCKLTYSPHKSISGGARVWIEVDNDVPIIPLKFATSS
ncbi:MAG: DNA-binding protein [Crocosphaera sp.]|nr:DNA-binding protein [Crocosphaera sp.]